MEGYVKTLFQYLLNPSISAPGPAPPPPPPAPPHSAASKQSPYASTDASASKQRFELEKPSNPTFSPHPLLARFDGLSPSSSAARANLKAAATTAFVAVLAIPPQERERERADAPRIKADSTTALSRSSDREYVATISVPRRGLRRAYARLGYVSMIDEIIHPVLYDYGISPYSRYWISRYLPTSGFVYECFVPIAGGRTHTHRLTRKGKWKRKATFDQRLKVVEWEVSYMREGDGFDSDSEEYRNGDGEDSDSDSDSDLESDSDSDSDDEGSDSDDVAIPGPDADDGTVPGSSPTTSKPKRVRFNPNPIESVREFERDSQIRPEIYEPSPILFPTLGVGPGKLPPESLNPNLVHTVARLICRSDLYPALPLSALSRPRLPTFLHMVFARIHLID